MDPSRRALLVLMIASLPRKGCAFGWTILAVIWLARLNCVFQDVGASDFLIRSWQTEEGLPQHSGTALAQTPDGYLWVGTFNGLARFNGVEFTRFTIANTPELKSDDINCLFVDSTGRLWIGTMIGLVSYENGTFKRWTQDPTLNQTDVRSVTRRQDGTAFAISSSGAWRIVGNRVTQIKLPSGQAPGRAAIAATNGAGQIWFGLTNHIYELDGQDLRNICDMPQPVTSFLVQDRSGAYWFRQEASLGMWKPAPIVTSSTGLRVTPEVRPIGNPRAFVLARSGDRWIGTDSGLYFWPIGMAAPQRIAGLPNDRIMSLLEDKDGNIWAGTDGGGLSLITTKQLTVYGAEAGLTGEDIISVAGDPPGQVWVGSFNGGLFVGPPGQWQPFRNKLFEPIDAAVAVIQTQDGAIWVGQYAHPVIRIENGRAVFVPGSNLHACYALFEDRQGRVWLGSHSEGVECFDKGEVSHWSITNGLSGNSISSFAQDRAGAIWIGTQNKGLNRLLNGAITQFHAPIGPASDNISALLVDSSETLWIGTVGAGLTRYKSGHFDTLSTRQGLYSDVVNQILEDDAGEIWVGSTTGIFAFSRATAEDVLDGKTRLIHCTVFNRKDGMKAVGTPGGFQPTNMKSRDGRLWFASGGGLVVIDPGKIQMGSAPPPVHIERLLVDGIEAPRTEMPGTRTGNVPVQANAVKTITVSAGAKRLELHYIGINFRDPAEVQYKYWLENYDADWQEAGTRPVAFFSKVPPGRYIFHVVAASPDSRWQKKGAELNVIILPFFWQTTWFHALVVVAGGALLWLIYHLRIKSIRQVEQLRIRIARDLHDDVGSNIANIALLSQLSPKPVLHHWPEPIESPELKEIHEVALETADILRDVTWFINPEFDTSAEMIHRLRAVAERMLKDRLKSFQIQDPITPRRLSITIRRNVLLIFKEILHNIIKHSRATEVRIEGRAEPGWFTLQIADNGIGFDPAKTSDGQGLESMRQRARQVHGTLSISSFPGQGARMIVKIPLA